MRVINYAIAVLSLGVIFASFYCISLSFNRYINKDVKTEVPQVVQNSVHFAAVSQEIARIEARRSLKLELALEQATQVFQALTEEKERLTKVLEETANTSADLIKENAELQKGLDEFSIRYENKVNELRLLNQQLTDATNKLDELTKKVADVFSKTNQE